MSETRFTWTYGASEGSTIFINDNNLQDPKGNGIGAITCHRIGNEEAERLANLFVRSPSMFALFEKALPIIQKEAHRRDSALVSDGRRYWDEMRELANEISAEIDRARGKGAE